jgi:hypothetical protein
MNLAVVSIDARMPGGSAPMRLRARSRARRRAQVCSGDADFEKLVGYCVENGISMTKAREVILHALLDSRVAPSMTDILRYPACWDFKLRTATLQQFLRTLESIGAVERDRSRSKKSRWLLNGSLRRITQGAVRAIPSA